MTDIIRVSELTCPQCGHTSSEAMPMDHCQFYYECKGCGALLKPSSGDCCVFCSFGTVPCPSVQQARIEANRGAFQQ